MRSALIAASTAVLSTTLVFACSSAEPPATANAEADSASGPKPDPAPEETSDTSNPGAGTSGGTSGKPGSSSGDGGGGASSTSGGGSTFDGGAPVDGGNAGTKCLAGSVQETEDNNAEGQANVLPNTTTSFCGRISAAGDVDFATFTYPASGSNSIGWSFEYTAGSLKLDITADGVPVSLNDAPKPGKKYVIKVSSTAGATPSDFIVKVTMK